MTTPAGAPTLEQVAALAGVSRSTVSRVVNSSPNVTPDAVAAVTSAIEELGYVPNRAARSLASRRTSTIALVIPENTARFFADPYFAQVIHGVADYLSTTDFTLTLIIASETDPEKTRRYLQGGNVDGALILSHHTGDRSYVELASSIPVVFSGRPSTQIAPGAHFVDVDNAAAARAATQYMIDHGRSRIATLAGPQDMSASIDRLTGFVQAVTDAGLENDMIEYSDFSVGGGADAARRLLATGRRFDGLFAASAQIGSGAMSVLREHGLDIPRDVSITAIDNDYFSQNSKPPMTSVEQPTVESGTRIAETLVRLLNGDPDVPEITIMPTHLIERESV